MTKIKYFLAFALFILIGVSSVSANEITGSCYYTSDYGTVEVIVGGNDIQIKENINDNITITNASGNTTNFVIGCRETDKNNDKTGYLINALEANQPDAAWNELSYCNAKIDYNDFIAGCPSQFHYVKYKQTFFDGMQYTTTRHDAYGLNIKFFEETVEENDSTYRISFKLDKTKSTLKEETEESRPKFNCEYKSSTLSLTLGVYTSNYSARFSGTIPTDFNLDNISTNLDKNASEINSCSNLPKELYVGMNGETLEISSTSKKKYEKLYFEDRYTSSYEEAKQGSFLFGDRLLYHLRQWRTPLTKLFDDESLLNNYKIFKQNPGLENEFGICKTCGNKEEAAGYALEGARKIANYCYQVYETYGKNMNNKNQSFNTEILNRVYECIDFEETYNQLTTDKVLYDLTSDCGFMTSSLKEKIEWILNVIKIAGPILALGLGMFDFFKTIAAGDAEKEMKNTFKKFMIRIASAVLLLIVPIIISFLLDLFLEDKDGYDPNNPFCGLVKWDEIK